MKNSEISTGFQICFVFFFSFIVYDASSKEISFDEFQHSLKSFSEAALLLRRFETEQAAVDYLVSETGSPAEECASAYEIYRKTFD